MENQGVSRLTNRAKIDLHNCCKELEDDKKKNQSSNVKEGFSIPASNFLLLFFFFFPFFLLEFLVEFVVDVELEVGWGLVICEWSIYIVQIFRG